ncbi:MAG TPA: hypothetical protein VJ853_07075 [Thermoanaerobaculia bacterium]|nr:hypothetical protein [Thermoanaerobaculia bacterium]
MLSLLFAAAAYWTVHIDFPADRAQFDRVDDQYQAAIRAFYAAHNQSAPAVWRIVTADGAYLGLRPKGTMADVAAPSLPADLSKELLSKTAPISDATHRILRAHHSEIWHLESGSADPPKQLAIMRTDVVDPPRDDEYESAMKKLIGELSASGVQTIGFFSSYGDGAYHYIFSSDKPLHVPKLQGFGSTRDVAVTKIEIR